MEAFRRTVAFVAGLTIVVAALLDECPRVAAVALGLLLMGIFSVPETIGLIRGAFKSE